MQLLQRARMLLIKIVRDVLPLRGSFETIARSGMVLHHALGKLATSKNAHCEAGEVAIGRGETRDLFGAPPGEGEIKRVSRFLT